MEQSSSTAHNVLIEEVKVRGEFRSDSLESGNKGVQAFCNSDTPLFPGAAFPQWCMLYVQCCSVVSGWFQKLLEFPAACVGWSSYMQSAASPGACPHGREWWMLVGTEGSWVFYPYSQHLAAVIHKRYSNSLPVIYSFFCCRLLNKGTCSPFLLGVGVSVSLAVKWR